MTVIEIETEEEFNLLIKNNEKVIVDYHATFCGPCKIIAPKYVDLSRENPHIKFLKVDIVKNPTISKGIKSLPTFQLFLNSNLTAEVVGADYTRLKNLTVD